MFDIGFSELVVIAVVALIVIGPERLPAVARTMGTLLGRLRRYTDDVKAEVHRELQLDEIRKMQSDLAEQARKLETKVSQEMTAQTTQLNASLSDFPDSVEQGSVAAAIEPQIVDPMSSNTAVLDPSLPIDVNTIHTPR